MDLMDVLIQYPTCLSNDQLRAALIDQCPECNLMSLEVRWHQLAKLDPEFQNSAPPARTALHVGSKH